MVSVGVSWSGKTDVYFNDQQKTNVDQNCYIDLLKTSLLPECCWHYLDSDFKFLQDSVPSHHAKVMQQFLRQNTPDFVAADEWALYSPDLNPLNYCIWDILQDLVYERPWLLFANLQDLKEAIKNKWTEVSIETVRIYMEARFSTLFANRCDWIAISCSETCWTYGLFCTLQTSNTLCIFHCQNKSV